MFWKFGFTIWKPILLFRIFKNLARLGIFYAKVVLVYFVISGQTQSAFAKNAFPGLSLKSQKNLSLKITAAATKYGLDRSILSCVLKIESTYNYKAVSSTRDHGIGQINEATAKGFRIDVKRLTSDRAYSVDRAAYVLAHYMQLKKADEPATWMCRYNVGPGPLTGRNRGANCVAYLERLNPCITSYGHGTYL